MAAFGSQRYCKIPTHGQLRRMTFNAAPHPPQRALIIHKSEARIHIADRTLWWRRRCKRARGRCERAKVARPLYGALGALPERAPCDLTWPLTWQMCFKKLCLGGRGEQVARRGMIFRGVRTSPNRRTRRAGRRAVAILHGARNGLTINSTTNGIECMLFAYVCLYEHDRHTVRGVWHSSIPTPKL